MKSGNYITKLLSSVVFAVLLLTLIAPEHTLFAQRYSAWSAPDNLGQVVNTAGFDGCPSVTKEGLTLLFMSNVGSTAQNIYVSHREQPHSDAPWSAPESVGAAINTASFGEICPALSISGRYLYFASNRPGGCGGRTPVSKIPAGS